MIMMVNMLTIIIMYYALLILKNNVTLKIKAYLWLLKANQKGNVI